jgi:hypothetical protein
VDRFRRFAITAGEPRTVILDLFRDGDLAVLQMLVLPASQRQRLRLPKSTEGWFGRVGCD